MPTVYGDVAVPEGGAELLLWKSDFTLIYSEASENITDGVVLRVMFR